MKKPRHLRMHFQAGLRCLSPFLADMLSGLEMRLHTRRSHGTEQAKVANILYPNGNINVLYGPFAGMRYEDGIFFGPVTPRWIGSYEMELHPIFKQLCLSPPERIVDIGSAEGYYSIGLARLFPQTPVYSYDTDPISYYQQWRLSRLNSVPNLHLGRFCSREKLISHAAFQAFVLSDIEGFELDLFTQDVVGALARCDVLIEIHDHQGVSADEVYTTLKGRFEKTHEIEVFQTQDRDIDFFNLIENYDISAEAVCSAMKEHRARPQRWLWCRRTA